MAEKLNAIFEASPSGEGASGPGPESREEAGLPTPEDLRARRQARGLSQAKLAEAVGVSAALIGLIERGRQGLGRDLAKKILAALKD
jgi:DNA-binding XRE family transcriptional regulator